MATTDHDNELIVGRFFDAWNDGDFEVIDDVMAPDAEQHNPAEPSLPAGPEGEKRMIELYRSAFPDAKITIEETVSEGDKVAVRYRATGTHEGEFVGVEPTGNDVEVVGFEIDRLEDGQIVESWGLFDAMGLMAQLGAIESPFE